MQTSNCVKVLIVEDDKDDQYIVNKYLRQSNSVQYHVECVECLKEAFEHIESYSVHIVLLDLNIGPTIGLDTLSSFRKQNQNIPVVVLTGANSSTLGDEAIRQGADDYLPKGELNSLLLCRSIRHAVERKKLHLELERQLRTDPLTGLYNRVALFDRLDYLLENASRGNFSVAVILIDLDGFKDVNDTYGHRAGDELLRQFGARLRKLVRTSDMAARLSGDEFVLVFTNFQDSESLQILHEKKKQKLTQGFRVLVDKQVVMISLELSMGVYEYQPGDTVQFALSVADKMMYEDKKNRKRERE